MRFAGIDIGSRTIEFVVVDDAGKIIERCEADTGFDPITETKKLLNGVSYDRIMATGYGRNLFEVSFNTPTITEIKAHAVGAKACFPRVRTVLDIGGQDSKAIALFDNGRVKKFEMNDRCAAGTGKFLEIMAKTLGYTIDDFGREALNAEKDLAINSMCTVFAESEVTSLIAKGENRREIAKGLHIAVAKRAVAMLKRVSNGSLMVFTGGVAKNACLRQLISEALETKIHVPENPHFVGAYGAALLAKDAL
jgi:predicted CoA-substrate-specific enzyme activase